MLCLDVCTHVPLVELPPRVLLIRHRTAPAEVVSSRECGCFPPFEHPNTDRQRATTGCEGSAFAREGGGTFRSATPPSACSVDMLRDRSGKIRARSTARAPSAPAAVARRQCHRVGPRRRVRSPRKGLRTSPVFIHMFGHVCRHVFRHVSGHVCRHVCRPGFKHASDMRSDMCLDMCLDMR